MDPLKRAVRLNIWSDNLTRWFCFLRRALLCVASTYVGIAAFIYKHAPEDAIGRFAATQGAIIFLKDGAILFITALGLQLGGTDIKKAFFTDMRPWLSRLAHKNPTLYTAFDLNIAAVYACMLLISAGNGIYGLEPWFWVQAHLEDVVRGDICSRVSGEEVGTLVHSLHRLCGK